VENKDRDGILTFPYNDEVGHTSHVNSSLVQQMGTTFLKAIVICLLSTRGSTKGAVDTAILEESTQFKDPDKPKRTSAGLQKRTKQEFGKKIPSFVSGYVDGQPIYTTISRKFLFYELFRKKLLQKLKVKLRCKKRRIF
jgi:hypothetical protein